MKKTYRYLKDHTGGVTLFLYSESNNFDSNNKYNSIYLDGEDAFDFIKHIKEVEYIWSNGPQQTKHILKKLFSSLEEEISYIISQYFKYNQKDVC